MPSRILLVEDDQLNRYALKKLLEKRGYVVHEAEDGRKAITIMERERVDCILMDVQLPIMNGVEATKIIRAHNGNHYDPNVPIIALTAYAMPGDRERFLACGMTDYLAKPTTIQEVTQALQKYLASTSTTQLE